MEGRDGPLPTPLSAGRAAARPVGRPHPGCRQRRPSAPTSSAAWHTGIRTCARVEYRQVYPGIDLQFHGAEDALEHDFLVAPGADPSLIAVEFQGASTAQLDASGDLLLRTPAGELRQRRPLLYQT